MERSFNSAKLVLASASPRRSELLRSVGLDFVIHPADIEEVVDDSVSPAQAVEKLAHEKAAAVVSSYPDSIVIGADTIVVLGEDAPQCSSGYSILGKPKDREDARAMLRSLSGREHLVYTGYAVLCGINGMHQSGVVETRVRFRSLGEKELEIYLEEGEWSDKAGAYAIQGMGANLIDQIHGSYTNVIGLPIAEILAILSRVMA